MCARMYIKYTPYLRIRKLKKYAYIRAKIFIMRSLCEQASFVKEEEKLWFIIWTMEHYICSFSRLICIYDLWARIYNLSMKGANICGGDWCDISIVSWHCRIYTVFMCVIMRWAPSIIGPLMVRCDPFFCSSCKLTIYHSLCPVNEIKTSSTRL